ncbi:MAG: hypothetical protein Q8K32_06150 [Archangium sp.]|nr:hypothetical protein [Archangium sp.]
MRLLPCVIVMSVLAVSARAAQPAEQDAAVDRLGRVLQQQSALTPNDLTVAALDQRINSLAADVEMARARFTRPSSGWVPADVGENQRGAYLTRVELFTKADKRLAAARAALAMEADYAAYKGNPNATTAAKAQQSMRQFCSRLRSDEPAYPVCSREEELSAATSNLAAKAFDGGKNLPTQTLVFTTENRRSAAFTLGKEGARLLMQGAPLTDFVLRAVRPNVPDAMFEFVNCAAASSIEQCELIPRDTRGAIAVSLGDGDDVWLRGSPGEVVATFSKQGAGGSIDELVVGKPEPTSKPSGRTLAAFGYDDDGGGLNFAVAAFTKLPRVFVVFARAETPVTGERGGEKYAPLAPGEPVLLLNDRKVLRVNGDVVEPTLSEERDEYYESRKKSPADDWFTTQAPNKVVLPSAPTFDSAGMSVATISFDGDIGEFEKSQDKRVLALLKAREPVKACVAKEMAASGTGAGLGLATYNKDGTIKKVQSLTAVFETRAAKRCNVAPMLKKRDALLGTLAKESLERVKEVLSAP